MALGGTLQLSFAADVNLPSQIGRSFDLFDWAGVDPIGAFSVSSPYVWDLSQLYTTGEVMLLAVPEPSAIVLLYMAGACYSTRRRSSRAFFRDAHHESTETYRLVWRR